MVLTDEALEEILFHIEKLFSPPKSQRSQRSQSSQPTSTIGSIGSHRDTIGTPPSAMRSQRTYIIPDSGSVVYAPGQVDLWSVAEQPIAQRPPPLPMGEVNSHGGCDEGRRG